jgi:O-acetyl-ADP-ribose deacetylase
MIKIIRGDITQQTTSAIVNAANTYLIAGSGVCGAIHGVAGPDLESACRAIGSCPTGDARITDAYDLPCEYVIHAVAPRYWDGTRGESELLARCYQSIFELTAKHVIKSVSIPAIGTGIYRYPIKEATKIAFETALVAQEKQSLSVEFVCFDENTASIYEQTAQLNSRFISCNTPGT